MAMTPLGNHYLVRRVPAEEKIGSLYIPEAYREQGQMFEVLAAGPGRVLDSGATHLMQAAAGDGVVVLEHKFKAVGGSDEGFVRDEDLIAVDRGEGPEPANDYVQIVRDPLERVQERPSGMLVASYALPGAEVRERESSGDRQARAYQAPTKAEAPRSGVVVYIGPGRLAVRKGDLAPRACDVLYASDGPQDYWYVTDGLTDDLSQLQRGERVHWEKHLEAVVIGEHVYIRADDLCAVEVED